MPHCIVEYSQNLDQEVPPADWLETVKKACLESGIFAESDVKLRGFPYKNFMTAGKEDAFVHVTIRMLSGRPVEQKRALSHLVLDALTQFSLVDVSFTVEVCEMERDTHARKVILS